MNNGRKRILIVDDDEQVLFVWSSALARRSADCVVVTACDGQEALDRFCERPFDMVITDLRMPRMDGYQLTEALRNRDAGLLIIWLTGYRGPDTASAASRLGVFRCLDKPLTVIQIRDLVADALAALEP